MNVRVPLLIAGACCPLLVPAGATAQTGLLAPVGQITTPLPLVTETLDDLLGGGSASLPGDAVGDVLAPIAGAPQADGGAPVVPALRPAGPSAQPGQPVAAVPALPADVQAPGATVDVVSPLRRVARRRKLRLRVRSDEAGIVAIGTMVRPGLKRRGVARRIRHDRSVIHLETVVLAFRAPGASTVDLPLHRRDARRLGRSRNARMSVAILTLDLARNQSAERLKRALRR